MQDVLMLIINIMVCIIVCFLTLCVVLKIYPSLFTFKNPSQIEIKTNKKTLLIIINEQFFWCDLEDGVMYTRSNNDEAE